MESGSLTLTPVSSLVNIWYGVKFIRVVEPQTLAGPASHQGEAATHDAAWGVRLAAQRRAWNYNQL